MYDTLDANTVYQDMYSLNVVLVLRGLSSGSGGVDPNPGLAVPKHGRKETEEEFDQRYINYFNRKDIDGWEVRKAMNDMHGMDLVPEPKVVVAALQACRRVNDHALCVRYLEAIKMKSVGNPQIYAYIIQEIRPTLDELGISTPEELGYGEPELALANPYDMH